MAFAGVRVVGGQPSTVGAPLVRHVGGHGKGLGIGCRGDFGPEALDMFVRAARAGDTAVGGARFFGEEWGDHG